jgi:hypothetical protein
LMGFISILQVFHLSVVAPDKSLKHSAFRALDSFQVAALWCCCTQVFDKNTT